MYHKIIFQPRDLLFFRDGRPINDGHGANWPMPVTAYSAIAMAFYRRWREPQKWEIFQEKGKRFPSLKTFGPMPVKNGEIYVPTPADLKPGAILAPLTNVSGKSNIPASVQYPTGANIPPSKNECNPWISLSEYDKYLKGIWNVVTVKDSEFFEVEERPGIEIDPDTHSTVEHKLFFGSYLRMKEDVQMCIFADCTIDSTDVIEKFYENGSERDLIFGGQRGIVVSHCEKYDPSTFKILRECSIGSISKLVKWTLISPAAFQSGWRPNFVGEDGRVMLNVLVGSKPDRSQFLSRETYRMACQKCSRPLKARLVSAVIPKFKTYSGWNAERNQPERTLKIVPAGSVFYFEAETEEDGKELASRLSRSRFSEFYGSQGFGIGLCSSFNYIDFNSLFN